MRRPDEEACVQAMGALEAELVIPRHLEARLLEAALGDEGAGEAMAALEAELVIPRDIEARLLDAVTDATEPSSEASSTRDPERVLAARAWKRSRFAYGLAAAAASMGVAYAGWSWWSGAPEERGRPDGMAQPVVLSVEVERAIAEVAELDWDDGKPWNDKMAVLERLRRHVEALADSGSLVRVAPRYVDAVRRAFLDAGKDALEKSLRASKGEWLIEERANLKQYLLLRDSARLSHDAEWQTTHFATTCSEAVAAITKARPEDVRPVLWPHVSTFVRLVERGFAGAIDTDEQLAERVRGVLASAEPKRFYDVFVTPLLEEPRDPRGRASRENLAYPPITIESIFSTQPEVLAVVRSRSKITWGAPYEVLGVYTGKARRAILRSLDQALDSLARDAWIVRDEAADARTREALERVGADYDGLYIQEWLGFFRDVEIARAQNNKDAARTLRALAAPDSPLGVLLRTLAENTEIAPSMRGADAVGQRFQSVVNFGKGGDDAPFAGYRSLLAGLAGEVEARGAKGQETADASAAFDAAAKEAHVLVEGLDETARELLAPLLLAPLEAPSRN